MINDRRMMRAEDFAALGFLQEINRQWLHPRGMALSIEVDNVTGGARWGGVWDSRHDAEGIIFIEPPDAAKAMMVEADAAPRFGARQAALGYIIQPSPSAAARGPMHVSEVQKLRVELEILAKQILRMQRDATKSEGPA